MPDLDRHRRAAHGEKAHRRQTESRANERQARELPTAPAIDLGRVWRALFIRRDMMMSLEFSRPTASAT
jgi:hypothetical protein